MFGIIKSNREHKKYQQQYNQLLEKPQLEPPIRHSDDENSVNGSEASVVVSRELANWIKLARLQRFDELIEELLKNYGKLQQALLFSTTDSHLKNSHHKPHHHVPNKSNTKITGNTNSKSNNKEILTLSPSSTGKGKIQNIGKTYESPLSAGTRPKKKVALSKGSDFKRRNSFGSLRSCNSTVLNHQSVSTFTSMTASNDYDDEDDTDDRDEDNVKSSEDSEGTVCSRQYEKQKRQERGAFLRPAYMLVLHEILVYRPPVVVVDLVCQIITDNQRLALVQQQQQQQQYQQQVRHQKHRMNTSSSMMIKHTKEMALLDRVIPVEHVTDAEGRKPLHIAAMHGCDVQVIYRLLLGRSTGDFINNNYSLSREVVLYDDFVPPPGTMSIDRYGRTPLHYATLSALSFSSVDHKFLRRGSANSAIPGSAGGAGGIIGLPPISLTSWINKRQHFCGDLSHQLKALENRIDIVQQLLRACPPSVHIRDKEGRTPVDIARESIVTRSDPRVLLLLLDGMASPFNSSHGSDEDEDDEEQDDDDDEDDDDFDEEQIKEEEEEEDDYEEEEDDDYEEEEEDAYDDQPEYNQVKSQADNSKTTKQVNERFIQTTEYSENKEKIECAAKTTAAVCRNNVTTSVTPEQMNCYSQSTQQQSNKKHHRRNSTGCITSREDHFNQMDPLLGNIEEEHQNRKQSEQFQQHQQQTEKNQQPSISHFNNHNQLHDYQPTEQAEESIQAKSKPYHFDFLINDADYHHSNLCNVENIVSFGPGALVPGNNFFDRRRSSTENDEDDDPFDDISSIGSNGISIFFAKQVQQQYLQQKQKILQEKQEQQQQNESTTVPTNIIGNGSKCRKSKRRNNFQQESLMI